MGGDGLNVAMICTEKLPVPPVRGGAIQTYIDGVLPHLAGSHALTVYCRSDAALPDEEESGGVRFVRVDPGRSAWTYGTAVADRLAAARHEVLHAFNRPLLVPLFHEASPASRIVLSVHNEMFGPEKLSLETGQGVVAQLDRIVTISRFIENGIRTRFPASAPKLRTIYSAADVDRFLPRWDPAAKAEAAALRERLGLGDRRVLLYVGRLSPKKGAHVVIEAVRLLQRHGRGLQLVVVGSKWYGGDDPDPYIDALQRTAETLSPPAVFTGYVPYSEVHRYFWLADVFVCASQWEEPLSRTHYEAMAAGVPIVTTDRGGNAEVVRGWRNGVICERHDDPVSMSQAIRRLLSHPGTRRARGQRGRRLAERRYTWKRVAGEIEEVYRQLPRARR